MTGQQMDQVDDVRFRGDWNGHPTYVVRVTDPTAPVLAPVVVQYDRSGVVQSVHQHVTLTVARKTARDDAARHHGWVVDETSPGDAALAACPYAGWLGPRRPGGVYRSEWGRITYVVLAVDLAPAGVWEWLVTERDLTGGMPGRVRVHSTAWHKRATVISPPVGRPALTRITLVGARSGAVHAATPVDVGWQVLCDAQVRRDVLTTGLPVTCRRCTAAGTRISADVGPAA